MVYAILGTVTLVVGVGLLIVNTALLEDVVTGRVCHTTGWPSAPKYYPAGKGGTTRFWVGNQHLSLPANASDRLTFIPSLSYRAYYMCNSKELVSMEVLGEGRAPDGRRLR